MWDQLDREGPEIDLADVRRDLPAASEASGVSSNAESVNDPDPGPEPPLLDVRDLRVRFRMLDGTIFAVNGISLHLDRGETLGLVGESGSGKSVTSLALMRLLPPEPAAEIGGEIEFDGRDISSLSEKQMRPLRGRDIAMVFQDPMTSLNPVLRIGEQVEETIKAHREIDTAGARARATELLRLVGIAATPNDGSSAIRTSSAAACASG